MSFDHAYDASREIFPSKSYIVLNGKIEKEKGRNWGALCNHHNQ